MSPLAAIILELTLRYGPVFVQQLIQVAHKDSPTLADWNAAFDLAKNPIVQVGDVPKFAGEGGIVTIDLSKLNPSLGPTGVIVSP